MSISQRSSYQSDEREKAKQKDERLPRGLSNHGNTCYFNSAMQALCHSYILHKELEEIKQISSSTVLCQYKEMCRQVHNGKMKHFSPMEVRKQFVKSVSRFDNYRQHDSHECLRHFLDEMRKEEKTAKSSSAVNRDHNLLTAVDKVFGGHLITVYNCKECDKDYHLFEPCLDISLPVFLEEENTAVDLSCNEGRSMQMGAQQMSIDEEEETGEPTSCFSFSWKKTGIKTKKVKKEKKNRKKVDKKKKKKKKKKRKSSVKHSDDAEQIAIKRQELQRQSEINDANDRYKQSINRLKTRLSSNSSSRSLGRTPINLLDCLDHFSRVEVIHKEYLCTDCLNAAIKNGEASEENLKLTSATKQTLIFNPPAVLTVHFKRFELLQGEAKKRKDMVEYPEFLDIAPYCSAECLRNSPPRSNIWYSLYAVVVHSGSLKSGHYVTFIKDRQKDESVRILSKFLQQKYFHHNATCYDVNDMMAKKIRQTGTECKPPDRVESKWYLLNDSSVRKSSLEEVRKQEAYLLFYERTDDPGVPNAPDFSRTKEVLSMMSSSNENRSGVRRSSDFYETPL